MELKVQTTMWWERPIAQREYFRSHPENYAFIDDKISIWGPETWEAIIMLNQRQLQEICHCSVCLCYLCKIRFSLSLYMCACVCLYSLLSRRQPRLPR
jgi:hypothetical protein